MNDRNLVGWACNFVMVMIILTVLACVIYGSKKKDKFLEMCGLELSEELCLKIKGGIR